MTTVNNTTNLLNLPSDTIASIIEFSVVNFRTILMISQTNKKLQQVICEHTNTAWKCQSCSESNIGLSSSTQFNENSNEIALRNGQSTKQQHNRCINIHRRPFVCNICYGKHCGDQSGDYNKRRCRIGNRCEACDLIECYSCFRTRLSSNTSDTYSSENLCSDCQEEEEFGMGGC